MSAPLTHDLDRHRRVARAYLNVLIAQDADSWGRFVIVSGTRLMPDEIASSAWAFMTAARPKDAQAVAWQVLGEAGPPVTSFVSVWPEARAWAETASLPERRAYAAANFLALPTDQRRDFLTWGASQI